MEKCLQPWRLSVQKYEIMKPHQGTSKESRVSFKSRQNVGGICDLFIILELAVRRMLNVEPCMFEFVAHVTISNDFPFKLC